MPGHVSCPNERDSFEHNEEQNGPTLAAATGGVPRGSYGQKALVYRVFDNIKTQYWRPLIGEFESLGEVVNNGLNR
jgi:hypothetical protein